MQKPTKALLVFFNGKSNAGGAERMVLYLDEYLISRGLKTEIIDEQFLLNKKRSKLFRKIFKYRHFKKRKPIYMARFTSAYLWTRKKSNQIVISNGESTPFYPVDFVISQGCYHAMEKAYGRESDELSRIAKLQQRGLQLAKQIITVTGRVKEELINIYGLNADKISLVSNRVDTDYFKPLPKTETAFKTVLYAGRLEDGKGLSVIKKLAEVIEENENWKLLIACNNSGNTQLFEELKHTEIKIGLQLANINEEAYSKADIVIFPSLYESFGMVTIEALSACVPVIGTPVGIIPELAKRKFPGVYVLEPFSDSDILIVFDNIIKEFKNIDRNNLHEMVKEEYGIASYRKRLDEAMGGRLKLK